MELRIDTHDSESSDVAEDLIDSHIVWSNPCDPRKVRDTGGDPSGKPVPNKADTQHNQEVPVAADPPSISLGWVCRTVIVQTDQHGTLGKGLWPNHGGRPNQEPLSSQLAGCKVGKRRMVIEHTRTMPAIPNPRH